jgi:iron(III) transport system permease protein
MGYAVPGGVIAVGLLIPLAAVDNALDAFWRDGSACGHGLLLTGSITALLLAYMVRFMAAALQRWRAVRADHAVNGWMRRARSLGAGAWGGALRRVHLPMLKARC